MLQKTSIFKSIWPKVGEIDDILIKSSEYLMEVAHTFRLFLKQYLQGQQKASKTNAKVVVEKPDVVTIWVAKTFPAWQSCILETLKNIYDVCMEVCFERLSYILECYRLTNHYQTTRPYWFSYQRSRNYKNI